MEITQDSRCRLCLNSTRVTQDLFTTYCKYKFIVEDFLKLEIKQRKGLPTLICESCIEIINILINFKAACLKVQETLENQQIEHDTILSDNDNGLNNLNTSTSKDIKSKETIEDSNEYLNEEREIIENNVDEVVRRNNLEVISQSSDNYSSESEHGRLKKPRAKMKVKKFGKRETKTTKSKKPHIKSTKSTKVKLETSQNKKDKTSDEASDKQEKSWKKYAKSYKTPCYICGKMFDKFRIQYHINLHLGLQPFICEEEECKKSFSSPTHLRHHTVYHHSDHAPHECDVCGKRFKGIAPLRFHKTYHFDPKMPCTICGKLLRNRKALKRHMFSHTGERPHKCEECSKCYKNAWSLKVHSRVHTKEKNELLGNNFDSDTKLESETVKSKSSLTKSAKTTDVGNSKTTQNKLQASHRGIEEEDKSKAFAKISKKSYEIPCYICGKIFDKYRVEYHINSHLGLRPFICDVEQCKKAFSSPTQLRRHATYCHSDFAPFECDVCGKKFKGSAALRDHKTYHFDPKMPCTICGKFLRNIKALKRHMFSHTGERPHKCEECSKCFKNAWALKVHSRVHTKEKPFSCQICGMTFAYSSVLKHHNEKYHTENVA